MFLAKDILKNATINGIKGAAIGGVLMSSPFLAILLWELLLGEGNIPGEISPNTALKIKDPSTVTNQQITKVVMCTMFIYGVTLGGAIGSVYGIGKSLHSFFYQKNDGSSSANGIRAEEESSQPNLDASGLKND